MNPIENIKHDKKDGDDQWNRNSYHYDPTQGFMSLDADVGQQSQGTQHPQYKSSQNGKDVKIWQSPREDENGHNGEQFNEF